MVPDAFARVVADLYGDEGTAWLSRLPQTIADCERRWSLRALPPFELSYNYVAPAVRDDGTRVVLKLGLPESILDREIAALRAFDGQGAARLLDADAGVCALLLERLEPGTMLVAIEDDERATAVAAEVIEALRRPATSSSPLPTLAERFDGLRDLRARFDGGTGPLPQRLVEEVEALVRDLLKTAEAPVVLHGDLHHYNILRAGERWKAIDPHGLTGDPSYEVGALLINPLTLSDWPDGRRVTARRVAQLSERLGIGRDRVRGWGLAHALLSAWWSIEDHGGGWEHAIVCAEWIAAVRAP